MYIYHGVGDFSGMFDALLKGSQTAQTKSGDMVQQAKQVRAEVTTINEKIQRGVGNELIRRRQSEEISQKIDKVESGFERLLRSKALDTSKDDVRMAKIQDLSAKTDRLFKIAIIGIIIGAVALGFLRR
jgi:TolA-binding protein